MQTKNSMKLLGISIAAGSIGSFMLSMVHYVRFGDQFVIYPWLPLLTSGAMGGTVGFLIILLLRPVMSRLKPVTQLGGGVAVTFLGSVLLGLTIAFLQAEMIREINGQGEKIYHVFRVLGAVVGVMAGGFFSSLFYYLQADKALDESTKALA